MSAKVLAKVTHGTEDRYPTILELTKRRTMIVGDLPNETDIVKARTHLGPTKYGIVVDRKTFDRLVNEYVQNK